jgi:N-acyl-D-amino-acid deacylase
MPKTFGTFPLLMGDYVRRRGVLGLAEAISRVTSLPADRLGLADRGRLTPGLRADVVVFDPASIDNVATDDSPGEPPVGVRNVMVNGVWALRDGHLTSERSGVVLT